MTHTRIAAGVAVTAALAVAIGAFFYLRPAADRLAFQGWVEAYLIFVSPDEAGRVEMLAVREGDAVEAGAALFTLDADLQRAAVAENEAAVINARQTFDRARELLKKNVGSQKAFDDAEAALRTAEARLNSTQDAARAPARQFSSNRHDPGSLFPGRRDGAGRAADRVAAAAGQRQGAFLRAAGPSADGAHRGPGHRAAATAARPTRRRASASSRRRPSSRRRSSTARRSARAWCSASRRSPERPADLRTGQPVSVALQGTPGASHARK